MSDVSEVRAMYEASAAELRATVQRLTGERDKAREECGFEKGMRASMRIELNMFIRLNMESTARAEAAEQALTDQAERIAAEWDEWARICQTPANRLTNAENVAYIEGCERLGIDGPGWLSRANVGAWIRGSVAAGSTPTTTQEADNG